MNSVVNLIQSKQAFELTVDVTVPFKFMGFIPIPIHVSVPFPVLTNQTNSDSSTNTTIPVDLVSFTVSQSNEEQASFDVQLLFNDNFPSQISITLDSQLSIDVLTEDVNSFFFFF